MHLQRTGLIFICLSITCSVFGQKKKAETLPAWDVKPVELTALNSPFRDINLSITPNGRYLYFMSGRGGQPWSYPDYTTYRGKSEHDGDIWFSRRINETWQPPVCLAAPVNTSSGEDEPNISADGQTVYFQSWKNWTRDKGPYYRAELHGEKWGAPVALGGGIHRFFASGFSATDGMSVSPDGNTLVVAAGKSYEGPMDIYLTRKGSDGVWGYPEKLDISTPGDERSVFIGADNRTLYFASNGWGGFGKLDIFKTVLLGGGKCGEVFNIGEPFNTKEEDYGFVMDVLRDDIYFVRNGDIFFARLGPDADPRIKPQPVIVLEGAVKDPSGQGLEALVTLRRSSDKTYLTSSRSNARTGEYSLVFPRQEGDYTQEIRFNETYIQEQHFSIGAQTPTLIEKPIVADAEKLKPAPLVAKTPTPDEMPAPAAPEIDLNDIGMALNFVVYFDTDRADLTPAAVEILSQTTVRTIGTMSAGRQCTLSLTGHTDADGKAAYNLGLSKRRVEMVAEWLKNQGIQLPLVVAAKGETTPIADNATKAGRQQNRRVEVRVECSGR